MTLDDKPRQAFNEVVAAESNGVPPPTDDDYTDNGRARPSAVEETVDESWVPVDLAPVLSGTHEQPLPDFVVRDDGRAVLYAGSINGVHGDSGIGKGWLVAFGIVEQARRGHSTMLLDFEDTAASIIARLQLLGMSADAIRRHLVYVRPQTEITALVMIHLCQLIAGRDVTLVVVDSIGEAFAVEGLDENKDVEVGPWYRRVARPLADTGAAVWLIDHSTKASDNPLHPSGSKRKRAAITGASYFVEATTPFVKDEGGRLRLTCAKDRHGNYRRGEVVGNLVMTFSIAGTMHLDLYSPAIDENKHAPDIGQIEAAATMAVELVAAEGRPLSQRALVGLIAKTMKERRIACSTDDKRDGIDLARDRGLLTEQTGSNRSRLFSIPVKTP